MKGFRGIAAALALGVAIAAPSAAVAAFVDWTSFTPSGSGQGNGSAQGTLTFGADVINVSYAGGVYSGGGTTTSTTGVGYYASCATYTPCIAVTDNIANDGGAGVRHTVTFSSAVLNPHFHIFSMGQAGIAIDWTFDDALTILSGTITNPSGNVVHGAESHGTVEFLGEFTQLSWVSSGFENTTNFTISADQVRTAVPEPGSLLLLGLGLLGAGVGRRRRK